MPTFRHGRNTTFWIQASGGTLTNISDTLRDVSMPISLDTPETTAFGSTVKTYVVGIKDARFSISGMFDATVDALLQGIFGLETARTWEYGPEGSTTGRIKYSGSAYLTSYQVQGSVSDMVAASCEFQVTGPVTRGVWA
jgi:hypothetical protein